MFNKKLRNLGKFLESPYFYIFGIYENFNESIALWKQF